MRLRLQVTTALAVVMLASAAQAADLPRKAPVYKAPPVAVAFSWTGFYIGGHVGYGWGKTKLNNWFDPISGFTYPGPDASYDTDGFLAGGQVGYNWQTGNIVLGIEADASWTDIKGSGSNDPLFAGFPTPAGVRSCLDFEGSCETKVQALGTITGRLGIAADRALFYAKGGAAWMNEKHTFRASNPADPTDPFSNFSASREKTRWGWTVGAGIEYAFTGNWSAKIEYNYLDFGDEKIGFTFAPPNNTFGLGASFEHTMHVVKGGINYRF
jgi:outer membrane immunogenic protein